MVSPSPQSGSVTSTPALSRMLPCSSSWELFSSFLSRLPAKPASAPLGPQELSSLPSMEFYSLGSISMENADSQSVTCLPSSLGGERPKGWKCVLMISVAWKAFVSDLMSSNFPIFVCFFFNGNQWLKLPTSDFRKPTALPRTTCLKVA